MKYLFIGGSRDGQRMAVEKENVDLPVAACAVDGEIEWEHYKSFRIVGESYEFVVYALGSMSPDDILRTLLAKYQREATHD